MRTITLIVFGFIFSLNLLGQMLTGRIVDSKEQPVPNASVYIREVALGIMANENGEFQTKIDAGEYTVDISSLGYERKTMPVSVPPESLHLIVPMTEKIFTIREVIVTPGKEDPAYRIMRNVIARAPIHLRQVKSFESDVYLKGTFKLDKLPAIVKSQMKDKSTIGKLMVYESQNEIKYHEPDKYEQRIVALSSTLSKDFYIDDKMPILTLTANIYSPTSFGGLLGPGAFSLYKFKLEDIDSEGNHEIYKIRLTPRKKNSQLVSGYLYVVDKTWSVQQAQLDASYMGVKGGGHFYGSVKYNKLETKDNSFPSSNAIKPDVVELKAPAPKQQKDIQKIEELIAKDELTTREAYKIAQLITKTTETDEMKEKKRQLEIPSSDYTIAVTRDSLALLRDSSFWNSTRTTPLQPAELRSYVQRDSLKLVVDSLQSADSLKNRTFWKWTTHLLLGERVNFGKKYLFSYGGLIAACPEYNFVDGFRIGQRFNAGINFDKNHASTNTANEEADADAKQDTTIIKANFFRSLSISPAVYYTTARKEVDFFIDWVLSYAPMRNGRLTASTGNTIADFAGQNGSGRFANTLASFFVAENTAKFYQKRFVNISNQIDIANGLALTTGFLYENRNDLENKTSFNLFNREPASNRPHGQTETMPDHKAYIASIELNYTPRLHYRVRNGQKYYDRSKFPTFNMRYQKSFSDDRRINSSYEIIEITIHQQIRLNLFNNFFYSVNGGTFLSAKNSYLPDYRHFQTNEMFLATKSFNTSFSMDNYRYATNDRWLQAHIAFSSQYLLLKQLPFLQRFPIDEAAYLKTLWTPDVNHNEAGYSIGLGDLLRIGVFVGFNKQRHESVGFVLGIPLFNTTSR